MSTGPVQHLAAGEKSSGIAVALGLALGPAVGLGLARFAYALLLPTMRTDLGWSFSTAGAMNTANALGYLVGALVAAPLGRRIGARTAFVGGGIVTTVALLASAASGNLALLMSARAVAGIAGAVSFVIGAGLAAQAGARHGTGRAALLLGVYFAGGGVGIVVSGLTIPALLGHSGADAGWRLGWLLLGGIAALATLASVPAARAAQLPVLPHAGRDRWPVHRLLPAMGAYALFGVGYISYMTFIIAFLQSEGARTAQVSVFWAVLGAAGVVAGFAWGPVLGRLRGGRGMAVVMIVLAAGAALPLVSASPSAGYASAVLFGGAFLTVVTAVTTVARTSLHPRHWTPAIATLTVAFAVGQCAGPVLAGVLSDGPTGTRAGLTLSVAILLAGALLAACQPHRLPEPSV